MSHGRPAKWTGRMALVRSVTRAATAAGSMFKVTGSTSASTGVAPAWMMALTVAQNVSGVVMTSSPGRSPAASRLRCRAAVQELSATAWSTPLVRREGTLEPGYLGPGADPPTPQAGDHLLDVFLRQRRGAEDQESILGADRGHGPRARPVAVMRPPASRTARQATRDSSRPSPPATRPRCSRYQASVLRRPARNDMAGAKPELAADLARIDGVAAVVALAILHEGHQRLRRPIPWRPGRGEADRAGRDRRRRPRPPARRAARTMSMLRHSFLPADVVGLAHPALEHDVLHRPAVVLDVQPVAHVAGRRRRPAAACPRAH